MHHYRIVPRNGKEILMMLTLTRRGSEGRGRAARKGDDSRARPVFYLFLLRITTSVALALDFFFFIWIFFPLFFLVYDHYNTTPAFLNLPCLQYFFRFSIA